LALSLAEFGFAVFAGMKKAHLLIFDALFMGKPYV